MTIREVIEMLKNIFALIMQYIAPLFGFGKDDDAAEEESTTVA